MHASCEVSHVAGRFCSRWLTRGCTGLALSLLLMTTSIQVQSAEPGLGWAQLPSLPDREGFAAMFAGVSGDALIAAGGANFPDQKPWEGGQKVWYDSVFVLEKPTGKWRLAGKLPRPLGYGVSVSFRDGPGICDFDGVVCVGGSDADRHYAEAFIIEWAGPPRWQLGPTVLIKPLPPLPHPVANACGALLGNTLYVAGGIEKPDSTSALRTFHALDLGARPPKWRELPPWPGPPRMLATAAAMDGSFYLASGTDLSPGPDGKPVRTYLRDAYRFTPGKGWKRIADLPRAAVAAPSPAPVVSKSRFLVMSGDDASQLNATPTEHQGFPRTILAYDSVKDTWQNLGEVPAPRVTVPTAFWQGQWVVISGEQRPGVRSPEVWSLRAQP